MACSRRPTRRAGTMNSGSTTSASSVSRHSRASIAVERGDQHDHVADDAAERAGDRVLGADDVVVQPADERAGLGAGEEGDRHPLHLGEQRDAQVVDEALADARAAPPLHDRQAGVGQRRDDHDDGEDGDQPLGPCRGWRRRGSPGTRTAAPAPAAPTTRMATRNQTMMPRYGRANCQARRSGGPLHALALHGLAVARHQSSGVPSACERGYGRSLLGGTGRRDRGRRWHGVRAPRRLSHPCADPCTTLVAPVVLAGVVLAGVSCEHRDDGAAPTQPNRARRGPTRRPRSGGPTFGGDDDAATASSRSAASRCRSTTTTRRRARSICTSPATWPPTRTHASAACWSTRAGPASAAATSPSTPSRSTATTCSSTSTSSAGTRAARASATPAIDCIDDYDRYYAGTDITPDDDAERQELVDLADGVRRPACAQRNADIIAARRHQRLGPRHGRHPRRARRGRRSATSASATAASSAPRGRRCSPTPFAPRCSTAPSTPTADLQTETIAADRGLRAAR